MSLIIRLSSSSAPSKASSRTSRSPPPPRRPTPKSRSRKRKRPTVKKPRQGVSRPSKRRKLASSRSSASSSASSSSGGLRINLSIPSLSVSVSPSHTRPPPPVFSVRHCLSLLHYLFRRDTNRFFWYPLPGTATSLSSLKRDICCGLIRTLRSLRKLLLDKDKGCFVVVLGNEPDPLVGSDADDVSRQRNRVSRAGARLRSFVRGWDGIRESDLGDDARIEGYVRKKYRNVSLIGEETVRVGIGAVDSSSPLGLKETMKKMICHVREWDSSGKIFWEPVHPGVDSYYATIYSPIDLRTIEWRVNSNALSATEFVDCLLRLFENCVLFNGKDSQLGEHARQLRARIVQELLQNDTFRPIVQRAEFQEEARWRVLADKMRSPEESFLAIATGGQDDELASPKPVATKRVRRLPGNLSPERKHQIMLVFVDKMMDSDCLQFFHQPVSLEQFPDYLEKVEKPMDYSTLKKNVAAGMYSTWEEFLTDVDLVLANGRTYNDKSSCVYKEAVRLRRLQNVSVRVVKHKLSKNPNIGLAQIYPPKESAEAFLAGIGIRLEDCKIRRYPLQECLTDLTKADRFAFFHRPVDLREVPNYNDVIERPMCFEVMKKKLHSYTSLVRFKEDFELICRNAMKFNPYPTLYHRMAKWLLEEGLLIIYRLANRLSKMAPDEDDAVEEVAVFGSLRKSMARRRAEEGWMPDENATPIPIRTDRETRLARRHTVQEETTRNEKALRIRQAREKRVRFHPTTHFVLDEENEEDASSMEARGVIPNVTVIAEETRSLLIPFDSSRSFLNEFPDLSVASFVAGYPGTSVVSSSDLDAKHRLGEFQRTCLRGSDEDPFSTFHRRSRGRSRKKPKACPPSFASRLVGNRSLKSIEQSFLRKYSKLLPTLEVIREIRNYDIHEHPQVSQAQIDYVRNYLKSPDPTISAATAAARKSRMKSRQSDS